MAAETTPATTSATPPPKYDQVLFYKPEDVSRRNICIEHVNLVSIWLVMISFSYLSVTFNLGALDSTVANVLLTISLVMRCTMLIIMIVNNTKASLLKMIVSSPKGGIVMINTLFAVLYLVHTDEDAYTLTMASLVFISCGAELFLLFCRPFTYISPKWHLLLYLSSLLIITVMNLVSTKHMVRDRPVYIDMGVTVIDVMQLSVVGNTNIIVMILHLVWVMFHNHRIFPYRAINLELNWHGRMVRVSSDEHFLVS